MSNEHANPRMKRSRYFSVGTSVYQHVSREAVAVARAASWLSRQRNGDGTWGGPDALDQLISTNHAVMALMSVGCSPESRLLQPAISFLTELDTDAQVSFFWRAGTLLNLEEHQEIVEHDMNYIWSFRKRIGVHRDYPVPFFLLKLMRLADPLPRFDFSVEDVLAWVLSEWSDEDCWYGRASITSMALALIYDLDFPRKRSIVRRARQFIESQYSNAEDGRGFSSNIVEDAFIVFNLCERGFFEIPGTKRLQGMIAAVTEGLVNLGEDEGYWESPPPFGGSVGPTVYPTAVMVRAILSYLSRFDPGVEREVGAVLVDELLPTTRDNARFGVTPFWGQVEGSVEDDLCFVLMPFSPRKLTAIYERYVKEPLESGLGVRCQRADDIYQSTDIMKDVWRQLNRARVVIADLTNRNPNVFYELGMAHVLGKRVVLIAQSTENTLPFDLQGVRTIIYEDGPDGYEELAAKIVRYVGQALS